MDELTLLRELDADTPPPEPRAMYAARSRLRSEIAWERDRPSRWQAPRMFATAVAVAAAVAVGAIVLGGAEDAATPEMKVQLTAAGEWLDAASRDAAAEAGVPGAVPRDDQYLYLREIVKKDSGARLLNESWLPVSGEGVTRSVELGRSWDSPAGWMPVSWAFLKSLPTEPEELLLYARSWPQDGRSGGEPMSEDDYIQSYVALMGLLRHDPPMPGGLRPAIFEALARIPGVEMTEDAVDARGRHGVGFKATPRFPVDIIEPGTYEYLGQIDRGEEQRSAVVERSVVDRIGQRP